MQIWVLRLNIYIYTYVHFGNISIISGIKRIVDYKLFTPSAVVTRMNVYISICLLEYIKTKIIIIQIVRDNAI
jgi:hypothetical protein